MESNPRKPWIKRFQHKLSKSFKSESQSRDQVGSLAVADPPDRLSNAPPRILQGPSQVGGLSVSVAHDPVEGTQSEVGHHESAIDSPSNGQRASTIATEASPTPDLNQRATAAITDTESSFSTTHSASQTARIAARGVLRVLSNVADGIPIPGVKGIFDTMTNIIDIVEVSEPDYPLIEYIDRKSPGHRN